MNPLKSKMECKICNHSSDYLFTGKILKKYEVGYYKCSNCGFIQTEKPYWLKEAYNDPIHELDIGLLQRNITLVDLTSRIINKCRLGNGKFIDYGGGFGIYVRLMRDKGYDFYYKDEYAVNLFSKYFTHDNSNKEKYNLLTAFEVFEHLEEPLFEIEKMFGLSDNILFTTQLVPQIDIKNVNEWWYFVPEAGQHISFYSQKALTLIAEKFNSKFLTNGYLHLLCKEDFKKSCLHRTLIERASNYLVKNFLTSKNIANKCREDFDLIKNNLKND